MTETKTIARCFGEDRGHPHGVSVHQKKSSVHLHEALVYQKKSSVQMHEARNSKVPGPAFASFAAKKRKSSVIFRSFAVEAA